MSFAEHARSLVSYVEWADERVLDAAQQCTADEFRAVHDTFSHMLGTMIFWHGLWQGQPIVAMDELVRERAPKPDSAQAMWAAYAQAHDDLRGFVMKLEDADWHRAKRWWTPYSEAELPLGETLVQVVNHSTQHRSEIAVVISAQGHSPGELDYLDFAIEMHGQPRH
jgi:uncharacterized damage-inducible protein DinB